MLRLSLLVMVLCVGVVPAHVPSPCVFPSQFAGRVSMIKHTDDQVHWYYFTYDALSKRRVLNEEKNVGTPGRQFRGFLELGQLNVLYEINLTFKTCNKTPMTRPWRPWGIPPNATFETESYIGGPGEEVFAQEWSDREYWLGVFSLKNCYPIREILVEDYEQVNSTITTNFYDIVLGIPDPKVFNIPAVCPKAQ